MTMKIRLKCRNSIAQDPVFLRKFKLTLGLLIVVCVSGYALEAPTSTLAEIVGGNEIEIAQQSKKVTGSVFDSQKMPVAGATIHIKGKNKGTISDSEGKYSIDVVEGETLVFSFVGMKTQEIVYDKQKSIDVALEDDAVSLEEVVAIGYGTARRRDLTGSVASISGQTLAQIPISDPAQALSGRLPGVQIITADGTPGAEVVIRVRGGGSITGDNSPLIIVDGFPASSMNDISTTDIESIDVLKDASATAIYGSQGANGVILITTKSAKSGTTQVVYDGFMQIKSIARRIDVLDTYEFALLNYEYAAMNGASGIESFERKYGVWDDLPLYKEVSGTNWQDELFGAKLISSQHSISIRGGSDKTKFTLSTVYNKDNGLIKSSNYERYYSNFKLDHQLFKRLKLDLNVRVTDVIKNGSGTSGDVKVQDVLARGPVKGLQEFVNVDPSMLTEEEYNNWLKDNLSLEDRAAQNWKKQTQKKYGFLGGVSWNILKGLTYRLEGGYTASFDQDRKYYGELTSKAQGMAGLPLVEWTKTEGVQIRQAQTLNYTFKIKDVHKFNLLAGEEINITSGGYSYIQATHFSKDLSPEKIFANIQLTDGLPNVTSRINDDYKRLSYFGRFMYDYQGKYYFTGTFRADGSSKFPPASRWGYFPAGSVAWRLSEEPFMKWSSYWLSNLKLRLSYGVAGNDKVKADLWKQDYAVSTVSPYSYDKNLNGYYTAKNKELPNPNLKWETTITRNLGLDFGLFHERLTGSFDAFWNTADDLLVERSIVAPGYTTMVQNVGATSNKGIELILNSSLVEKKDFSLSVDFNFGMNKSNVDRLAEGVQQQFYNAITNFGYDYVVKVGEPVGLFWGFETDGYYSVDDFDRYDASSRKYIPKEGVPTFDRLINYLRPGSVKFRDISGPDGKPDGIIDVNDETIIGRADPDFYGGFGLSGRYKSFDFAVLCSYMVGNKVYNATKVASAQRYRRDDSNQLAINRIDNRFTYLDQATGTIVTDLETLRTMNEGKTMWSPLSFDRNSMYSHSWNIDDGSFLRVQNILLGYTIPQSISKKVGIQKFRFYTTVTNPFLFTKYPGYDPEVSNSSNRVLMPGLDSSSYPRSTSWTFGLNITF